MTQAAERSDPVARAFPGKLGDSVHDVVGAAIVRLVDAGYPLEAARAIVREAVTAIIEDFES